MKFLTLSLLSLLGGVSSACSDDATAPDGSGGTSTTGTGGGSEAGSGGSSSRGSGGSASGSGGSASSTGGARSTGGTTNASEPVTFYFQGIKYPEESGSEWILHRFPPDLRGGSNGFPAGKSEATPGGVTFETDCPSVTVNFRHGSQDRYGTYGVQENGGAMLRFDSPKGDEPSLDLTNSTPGMRTRFEVWCPGWKSCILTGIDRPADCELLEFTPPALPAYVALGDSLTHGTGQNASFEGYAWQTAEDLGLELFNLAVGGSQVAPSIANTLGDWESVGFISVLVGFNDWDQGKSVSEYESDYSTLLETIRSHHSEVPIVCLEPVGTTASGNRPSASISDFRAAVSRVVAARRTAGDTQVYFAPAESWLNTGGDLDRDGIHLSVSGAEKLSDELTSFVQSEGIF